VTKSRFLLLVGILLALSIHSYADPLTFSAMFDGNNPIIDPTSAPIAGTSLVPGDSFILDIHFAGNDFWTVRNSFNALLFATFYVQDEGVRAADITTTLFLDAVQVAQDNLFNVSQSSVHIGGQTFPFVAATTFDQLVMNYNLLDTTENTVLTDLQMSFHSFRSSEIETYSLSKVRLSCECRRTHRSFRNRPLCPCCLSASAGSVSRCSRKGRFRSLDKLA
jgi:hypothetical protein